MEIQYHTYDKPTEPLDHLGCDKPRINRHVFVKMVGWVDLTDPVMREVFRFPKLVTIRSSPYWIHKCIYIYCVNTLPNPLYYTIYNTFQERERERERERRKKKRFWDSLRASVGTVLRD